MTGHCANGAGCVCVGYPPDAREECKAWVKPAEFTSPLRAGISVSPSAATPIVVAPFLILEQAVGMYGAPPAPREVVELQVYGNGQPMPGQLLAYAGNRGIHGRMLYAVPVAQQESV